MLNQDTRPAQPTVSGPGPVALPYRLVQGLARFARRRPVGAFCGLVIFILLAAATAAPWVARQDPLITHTAVKPSRRARPTGLAPTTSVATCSAASSTARAFRSGSLCSSARCAGNHSLGDRGSIRLFRRQYGPLVQRCVDAGAGDPAAACHPDGGGPPSLARRSTNLILLLGISAAFGQSRIIRSQVLTLKNMPFVHASRMAHQPGQPQPQPGIVA